MQDSLQQHKRLKQNTYATSQATSCTHTHTHTQERMLKGWYRLMDNLGESRDSMPEDIMALPEETEAAASADSPRARL
jgi:hypothetical protein